MMKKSLLAMAVAGAVAAPQAGAVTTLYGAVNQTLSWVEESSSLLNIDADAIRVHDNNSKLGVKGSEDLGNGMSAIFKIEYGLGLNGKVTDQTSYSSGSIGLKQRNTFVGLKGNFGTFLMGRHDVPAKIALGKVAYAIMGSGSGHAMNSDFNIGFSNHIRANNTLAYISPNFSGFTVSLATIAGEEADDDGADGIAEGMSLGIMYSNGPIYAGFGYTDLSHELIEDPTDLTITDDRSMYGLALKYAPSNWEVGYLFEFEDNGDGNLAFEWTSHYLYGGMKFGANKVYLQAGLTEGENGIEYDRTAYGVAFKHSLSKRSSFWAAVTTSEDGSDTVGLEDYESDRTIVSLGLTHKF